MDKLNCIGLLFNNMKSYIIVGAFFFVPTIVLGQENLVLNPNCDVYDTCPTQWDQINYCQGWSKFGNISTPDFFSKCALGYPSTFIPHYFGFQEPLSGDSYFHLGIINSHKPQNFTFWSAEFGNIESRESIKGTLTKALQNKIYYIEFYVSFSKSGYDDGFGGGDGRIATNAFDLILLKENETVFNSVIPYIDENKIINVNNSNNIIKDTLNWIKISTCFLASGDEKHFAIGAFRDTNDVLLEFSGGSYSNWYVSSYYFDNFAIYECDTCCLGQFPYEDHVTVSSNPGSVQNPTTFSILLNPNTTGTLTLYDSAGRLVAKEEFSQLLTTYTLPVLANGVYHYALTTSNGVKDVGKVLVVD